MLKNNKSVAAFFGVLSISSVASGIVLAKSSDSSNSNGENKSLYNKIKNAASNTKNMILNHKKETALILGGTSLIAGGIAAHNLNAKKSFNNINIVLIGPPGSGKGTHFETIANKFGLVHYSTGDMLREEVAKKSEDGKIADSYMKQGKLVPSNIIERLTRNNLLNSETGHVIDGSPRTVSEAKFLDSIGLNINAVLYLDVHDEEIIKRISGRRVCSCGTSYHILYNKPKNDGLCDKCGNKLKLRSDDQMHVVKERLKVFHEQTEPVLEYYEKQGKLIRINGTGSVNEVKQNLLDALDRDKNLKKLSKN